MQHIASVQCYDVLDQVVIAVQVREKDAFESDWQTVLLTSTSVTGDGESQPREWLRDSLVALLETL